MARSLRVGKSWWGVLDAQPKVFALVLLPRLPSRCRGAVCEEISTLLRTCSFVVERWLKYEIRVSALLLLLVFLLLAWLVQ